MSDGGKFRPRRFVLGEFADTDSLLLATKSMREGGHKKLDTHTPYPVHGIEEALGLGRAKMPTIILLAALTGAVAAYSMIVYMNAIDWPINVANRPPHSLPANIPITFELTVLFGGSAAFFALIGLMGLPLPYHPVFEAESFRRASIDAFFLSAEVPPGASPADIAAAMKQYGSIEIQIVEESER